MRLRQNVEDAQQLVALWERGLHQQVAEMIAWRGGADAAALALLVNHAIGDRFANLDTKLLYLLVNVLDQDRKQEAA